MTVNVPGKTFVTLRKIGNSEGVIIPKPVLDRLGVKEGDKLELSDQDGTIYLRPKTDHDAEFARRMKIARERMKKYEVALRELAK
jgi:putative addiction module antidote